MGEPFAGVSCDESRPPQIDPHSVELRSTPLPRSTGERKGASLCKGANFCRLAPFLSLRRGERWRREAATEWGKPLMKPAAAEK